MGATRLQQEADFNFRSEKRSSRKSTRCLIPASHFFEFTTPTDPKQRRKDKWRFTLAAADWFCIAGILREDAVDGIKCFTMLTRTWARRHSLSRPRWSSSRATIGARGSTLLRPLPPGSLKARLEHPDTHST
jgi:hypothetical protein